VPDVLDRLKAALALKLTALLAHRHVLSLLDSGKADVEAS
jgi:hypothetical protein